MICVGELIGTLSEVRQGGEGEEAEHCRWMMDVVGEAGGARPTQSQRPILLVLGPLDALEVNAILHHLPERAAKENRYFDE